MAPSSKKPDLVLSLPKTHISRTLSEFLEIMSVYNANNVAESVTIGDQENWVISIAGDMVEQMRKDIDRDILEDLERMRKKPLFKKGYVDLYF